MICYCWQLIDYLLEDPSEGALYSYTTEGPKSYQLEFLSPSGFGYLSPPLGTEEEMLEVRKHYSAPAAATPSVPKRPRTGGGSGEAGSSSQQATGEDDGTKKDRKKKPRKQQQQ